METIVKINWSNELSIGNVDIDNVHSRLIEIYNDLVEHAETNGNREKFAVILSKMTDYSLIHFKKEEAYMQAMSFPELAKHRGFHRDYIYRVAMFNVDFLGSNPPSCNEIINFLNKWWINHILHLDKRFEDYKKEFKLNVTY
jgi:hemerythrin